jgi:hypothetical protein
MYGESYGSIKNAVGRLCIAFKRYRPERLFIYYYSHKYLDLKPFSCLRDVQVSFDHVVSRGIRSVLLSLQRLGFDMAVI